MTFLATVLWECCGFSGFFSFPFPAPFPPRVSLQFLCHKLKGVGCDRVPWHLGWLLSVLWGGSGSQDDILGHYTARPSHADRGTGHCQATCLGLFGYLPTLLFSFYNAHPTLFLFHISSEALRFSLWAVRWTSLLQEEGELVQFIRARPRRVWPREGLASGWGMELTLLYFCTNCPGWRCGKYWMWGAEPPLRESPWAEGPCRSWILRLRWLLLPPCLWSLLSHNPLSPPGDGRHVCASQPVPCWMLRCARGGVRRHRPT